MSSQTLTQALRQLGYSHREPRNRRRSGWVIVDAITREPVQVDALGEETTFDYASGWRFVEAERARRKGAA